MRNKVLCRGKKHVREYFVANKVVGDAKRRKPPCLIFKVDFEKAYDCVLMEIFILYDEEGGV